jgi:hypothetical protein
MRSSNKMWLPSQRSTRTVSRASSVSNKPASDIFHALSHYKATFRKGAKSVVPFADRAIGNLQQWLIGTYHGVSRDQLQVYLDEFVFRHNRRQKPMAAFQTLLGLSTACRPVQYTQIKGASDLSRPGQKTNHNLWGSAETTSRKCLVAKENACQRHGKGKRT